jgi:thiol-disulfide isomerase/thioredoxin
VGEATSGDVLGTLGGMKVRRPRLLVGSLLAAIVIGGLGGYVWAEIFGPDDDSDRVTIETNSDVTGGALPDVEVSDADGNPVAVSSFVGDPLVINFWFSTCPPCAKELPDFAAVHEEKGDEVRFIGINMIDSVEVMEEFAGERGVAYELYRDDLAELTDGLEIAAFPQTIFVTSDGQIVDQAGVLTESQLHVKVDELIAREGTA